MTTETEDQDRTQAAEAVAEAAAAYLRARERAEERATAAAYQEFWAAIEATGEALAALRAAVAQWEGVKDG
jgi:hypothetical protein